MAMVISLLLLLLVAVASPYRSDFHNFIALGCSFCLCGVFFWSIIMKTQELSGTLDEKGLLPPELQQAFAFDYSSITYGLMGSFLGSLVLALLDLVSKPDREFVRHFHPHKVTSSEYHFVDEGGAAAAATPPEPTTASDLARALAGLREEEAAPAAAEDVLWA